MAPALLVGALIAGLGAALTGCEAPESSSPPPSGARDAQPSARKLENLRHSAAFLGQRYARSVVFYAQELTQLDPRSERAKASWEARKTLDELLTGPPKPAAPPPTPDPGHTP